MLGKIDVQLWLNCHLTLVVMHVSVTLVVLMAMGARSIMLVVAIGTGRYGAVVNVGATAPLSRCTQLGRPYKRKNVAHALLHLRLFLLLFQFLGVLALV